MELRSIWNWSESNSVYASVIPLHWVKKTQEDLVTEVSYKLKGALSALGDGETDPEEEKMLRHAAEIILTNSKHNAAKKLAEEWVFDIFISKLATDEEVRILLNKSTKLISQSEDVVDFSKKIYEAVQLQLLQRFDENKALTKELRDEFFQDIPEIYEDHLNNSVLHRIQGKNFLKMVKEAFIKQFLAAWKEQLYGAFDSSPDIRDLALGYAIRALEKSKSEIERVFPEYFFQMIRKEIHEKYLRKINSSTQKQKGKKMGNTESAPKLEITSIIDEVGGSPEDKALEEKIQEEISNFDLTSQEKKQLKNRLSRLKKNKKPLKTSDYLSGENPLIKAKDEWRFLDLVDQLGIEIIREKNKPNTNILQKSEGIITPEVKETIQPQRKRESWVPNLETPEEIAGYVLDQLEKCGYTFTNRERFRKEILEFWEQKVNRELLLWAAIDFQSPEKKSQSIFAIKVWWSARIFLIKQDGEFTVEKFCKNHNEYETYFSFLRKSFD